MKTAKFPFVALAIVATAAIFSFTNIQTGSIRGTVLPADGGVKAWAISATDTLKAEIKEGAFEIVNAKPGAYRLVIEAKPPYKNAARENIVVADGQPTDAGEIKLQQ
ncbi:MAG: carboxypeptidase-like regulatory domain-containing protein [Chitinophagaceae bacterium]|nr:carboxypeptidase-like regulatory domain-containing protein [Chitinophagaceae bacterium]